MLFGGGYASGRLHADRLLAIRGTAVANTKRIEGIEGRDPAFDLPGSWIEPELQTEAEALGYTVVDPITVLVTHFGEIVRSEAPALFNRAATVRLLEDVRARQPGLVEELVPNTLTVSDVQRVLQTLIGEGVSIANIDLIVEHLADLARSQKDPSDLAERVRERLGYAICHQLRGRHEELAVLSLDPRIENQIVAGLRGAAGTADIEPTLAERLLRALGPLADAMIGQGRAPVLLCSGEVRRPLRGLTRRALPRLAVISVNEIPLKIALSSFETVQLEPRPEPA